MRKIIVILSLVTLLSSCAWVCQHKTEISSGLNSVIVTAQMLEALGMPAPVVDLCRAAVAIANQGLASACPDVATLVAAQTKLAQAVDLAKAMGYRFNK